jgi:hypothetical protein
MTGTRGRMTTRRAQGSGNNITFLPHTEAGPLTHRIMIHKYSISLQGNKTIRMHL